ncbi:hypothetical protein [Halobacterium yunchengense]|uniref:hypothetical protein n=1 Tax=Halobacterium yunchengense TaxID=3108497 RepID=UPI003009D957
MSPVSLAAPAAGALCIAVGALGVFAPTRTAAACRTVFPAVGGDDQQWRAAGLVAAGVGLLLLSLA